jgi:hypothetical protein
VASVRIRDEIKYLYCKKQKLNTLIYQMHLTLANTWDNLWPHIYYKIEEDLQKEIRTRHTTLHKKFHKLTHAPKKKSPPPRDEFYPRVVNTTDIPFSDHEISLMQKDPKYNLHNKPKN